MSLNPHFNFTFLSLLLLHSLTAQPNCLVLMTVPFLLSWILAFLQPQYWTWPEIQQLGVGRSRQSYPAGTPSSGRGDCAPHGHGLLLQRRLCQQKRKIQPCVSIIYKDQPPSWQALGMAFFIFDFYCSYFNLCWLLTIKLSRHFLHIFFKPPQFRFPQNFYFLFTFLSSGQFPHLFFFSIFISLSINSLFKKSASGTEETSIYFMEKELKIMEIAGYFHRVPLLVGFILSSNGFSLSWLFCF